MIKNKKNRTLLINTSRKNTKIRSIVRGLITNSKIRDKTNRMMINLLMLSNVGENSINESLWKKLRNLLKNDFFVF